VGFFYVFRLYKNVVGPLLQYRLCNENSCFKKQFRNIICLHRKLIILN